MCFSLRTAAIKEPRRFSKVGTFQTRWFWAKQGQLLGNPSLRLLPGSLFPIMPAWMSLHWHPLSDKCHRVSSDHQVFSGVPFRKQHSYRNVMHFSLWLITCQGNFPFCFQPSSLCLATVSLGRKLTFVDSGHYALISFLPSHPFLFSLPPGIPFTAWLQQDAAV